MEDAKLCEVLTWRNIKNKLNGNKTRNPRQIQELCKIQDGSFSDNNLRLEAEICQNLRKQSPRFMRRK